LLLALGFAAGGGKFRIMLSRHGQSACIFGRLRGLASRRYDGGLTCAVGLELPRSLVLRAGLLEHVGRILSSPLRLGDLHGVLRLVQLDGLFVLRHGNFGARRAEACRYVIGVGASWHKLVVRLNRFRRAYGVGTNLIFKDDNVAGRMHRRIWLGRHDEAEGLQIAGHSRVPFVRSVGEHFAEIFRMALRRYGPEDVGQILGAELLRGREVFKVSVDFGAAGFRFDGRFAFGGRQ